MKTAVGVDAAPVDEMAARVDSPAGTRKHEIAAWTPLERGVMLAVIYADVFDFPLTHEELFERIIGVVPDSDDFVRSVHQLSEDVLYDSGRYVCLRGREEIIALRAERARRADAAWSAARRFAHWLRYVPFVRSVAVSGSLAVSTVSRTSDADFFCITSTDRLWIARLFLVPLSKATRHLPRQCGCYLCPNYLLDEASLLVPDQNLFTAHEVEQAVPLWGVEVHARFLEANRWTAHLLPNRRRRPESKSLEADRPFVKRLVEHLFGGRVGDWLNAATHSLFVRGYRLRARRRGWSWTALAPAYQRGRYTVPEGGYTAVVADIFRRRVLAAARGRITEEDIEALFPHAAPRQAVYDWKGLFQAEYGPEA